MSRRNVHAGIGHAALARSLAGVSILLVVAGALIGGSALGAMQPGPSAVGTESPLPKATGSGEPTTTPTPDVHILTAQELQAELYAAQADGQQRTVIADVALDTTLAGDHQGPQCLRAEGCPQVVGELVGVPGRPVWASPEVAASLGIPPPAQVAAQPLALSFASDDVIMLLGLVLSYDDTTVVGPASASALEPTTKGRLGSVVVVHGWLNSSGPLPCPMPASPTPPPNTPFVTCPFTWIGPDRYVPVEGTVAVPEDAIRVQPEAWGQFNACDDVNGAPTDCALQPLEADWLLQLVEDPRPNADPRRGWQVVGRLDSKAPPTTNAPSPIAAVTPDDPLLHELSPDRIGTQLAVRGWLVDEGAAVSCPTIPTPQTPPPDIHEPSCYDSSWITENEYQPFIHTVDRTRETPPEAASSVRVQAGAYPQFADDPQTTPSDGSVPRFGTYQLDLIRDPRFPVHGALGWKLVARLDP